MAQQQDNISDETLMNEIRNYPIQTLAGTEPDNVPVPLAQNEANGPPITKKPTLETLVMAASIIDANVKSNTSDNEGGSSSSSDNQIAPSEIENSMRLYIQNYSRKIDAMVHMRNDEIAVKGVIGQASEKCESLDYKQEMYKVLDRLIANLAEVRDYLLSIALPVMTLRPPNITNASMETVQSLCNMFPDDLKDNEASMAEIELADGSICRSETQNLSEAVKWFVGKSHICQNLSKAYRIALIVPIPVASNERNFSNLKLIKGFPRSTMKE
eukprot:gene2387-18030_t